MTANRSSQVNVGDIIDVRVQGIASKHGVHIPGMLRKAIVTSTWSPTCISCIAFNDQPGPDTLKCQSIPAYEEGKNQENYFLYPEKEVSDG